MHFAVPHLSPTFLKKKRIKKGAKKRDAPTDLVVFIMKRLRVKMSHPSRGENPKRALWAKSGTPLRENPKWDAQEKARGG